MNPMMMMPGLNRIAILPKPEMPAAIQILFAARPPLTQIKPPPKNKCRKLDSIINPYNSYLEKFEEGEPPERVVEETPRERRERITKEKVEQKKEENKILLETYNPKEDPKLEGDPLKTLYVARLNYETDEKKLRREFEVYGPIKDVKLVRDINTGKSRGYAFIEYENKNDFVRAYKQADGKKIDGRRVLVDCERGRTVQGWVPRRLGGGKGDSRKKKEPERELERERSHSPRRKEEKPKFGRDAYLERFKRGTDARAFEKPQDRGERGDRGRDRSGRDRFERGERGGERFGGERSAPERYGGERRGDRSGGDRYGGDRGERFGGDRGERFGGDRGERFGGDRGERFGGDKYGGERFGGERERVDKYEDRREKDYGKYEKKPYKEERTEEREKEKEKRREKRSRTRSRSYSKEKERRHDKEERKRRSSIEAGQIVANDEDKSEERKKKKKKDKEKKEKKEKKNKHKKKDKKRDKDYSSDEEGERDSVEK